MEEENIADTTIEFADEAFDDDALDFRQDEREMITITYIEGSVDMAFSDNEGDSDENNTVIGDPFNLENAELYEEILQYLDVKDILNLTEVSKFWNSYIGAISDNSMDRLKIVVDETHSRRFSDIVNSSTRRYKHLEIKGIFDNNDEMAQFIKNNSNWLVSIKSCYDIYLPSIILRHVEELFFFAKDMDKSRIFFFDQGLLCAALNVQTLIVWAHIRNSDFVKYVINCFYLKKLVLEFGAAACFLSEFDRCIEIGFKLEAFYCDANLSLLPLCGSFLRFIKLHRNSLTNIKFKGSYELVKEVLYELPKLKCLTFSPLVAGPSISMRIQQHANLKEANLICTSYLFIQNFIKMVPNLQTLYVSHLNRDILKIVAANAVKVSRFKFACPIEDTLKGFNDLYRLISINMNNNRSEMEIAQI